MNLPNPKIVFPLTGSTFDGRQAVLSKVCEVYEVTKQLSNYNGGLALIPEPDNTYDPFAIKILAATGISGGNPCDLQQIGYVPQRWCPKCGEFMMVRDRGKNLCKCGAFNDTPISTLNKYIIDTFVIGRINVATFTTWVGRGQVPGNPSYGMRVGLWWSHE